MVQNQLEVEVNKMGNAQLSWRRPKTTFTNSMNTNTIYIAQRLQHQKFIMRWSAVLVFSKQGFYFFDNVWTVRWKDEDFYGNPVKHSKHEQWDQKETEK